MNNRWSLYVGILLISLATLALQVLQVRIFSFMLWHHLAYMVITVTLLGFGAAGAYVAIKGTGDDEQARKKAGWSALLAAATTILGFAVVTRIPLDTYMLNTSLQLGFVFLYYAFLIFPYFFMGLAITLLLSRFTDFIHKLYFWNLIGSALGSALFVIMLLTFGGEGTAIVVSAIAAISAAFIFPKKSLSGAALAAAVVVLCLLPVSETLFTVTPAPTKALGGFQNHTPNLTHENKQWDPVARIDIVSSPNFSELMRYHDTEVKKIFTIDGDAFTFVYGFDKPFKDVKLLGDTLYGSAYFFKDKPKVAVIGLGGGTDIMTALHFEASEITGVEINQAMIDAANIAFKGYKYHPYQDPSVTIVHEEGRSFLRRVEDKYDIIQMSGVDTWSALATGAYVLSENYLYTKEAFQEYYQHLKKDGMLCMIRWLFDPPRECLRLATIQSELLREMGFEKPWHHFVVIQQGLLASVITKMTPFTNRDIERIKKKINSVPALKLIYAPGEKGTNTFATYFNSMKTNKESEFIDNYPYKLSSVYDDRPFFFEFYKWKDMFGTQFGKGGYLVAARPVGYIILVLSLIQALFFGCLFILFPLWKFKKKGLVTEGSGRMITYFSALGLGFMFIEVVLMQKFVLFLGHPTYSIAVTLFTLLIFSGIGSFIAGRFTGDPRKTILKATMGVALMALIYAFALTPMFNALLGLSLTMRIVMAVIVLAPLGIVMGMPFPTGLSYVSRGAESFVPWAFGINGVASVAGSVICIIIALFAGFSFVMACAIVIYLIGGFVMSRIDLGPVSSDQTNQTSSGD